MKKNTNIYIASPLGFSEVGRHFMTERLFPLIISLGYKIMDPWSLTPPYLIDQIQKLPYGPDRKQEWQRLNPIIGARNVKAIDESFGVIAILDGVDIDSGTASEIGYAAAKSKIILGYRGDFRLSADNEGSTVNLQVEYFIRNSGGTIATSLRELEDLMPEVLPL